MTINIELNAETRARLAAQASAQGLSLEKVAEKLLKEALGGCFSPDNRMSAEEFHQMLGALAEGSERLPVLPTKSFSRESFYEDRLNGGDAVPRR